MEESANPKSPTIVFGLDGATLACIRPLAAAGRLPNMARLMASGCTGPLLSTIHPITPQAWTTFLTGMNAGRHGVYDFTRRREGSYDLEFINASKRRAESVLAMMDRQGKKVGAIAVPFTYPPENLANGFMLSGLDSPAEDSRAVSPAGLFEEIKARFGAYHIHLGSPVGRKDDPEALWRDMQEEDENRTAVTLHLMATRPRDLLVTVFNNVDRIQHNYFDLEAEEALAAGRVPANKYLVAAYENADRQLGRILAAAPDDATVLVISDHGAGPIRQVFHLNAWLEQEGYLAQGTGRGTLSAVRGSREIAKRLLPRWMKNFIKTRLGGMHAKIESFVFLSRIDWSRTRAFGLGMYGNIHINLAGREPLGTVRPGSEYEALRDEIIAKLMALRDPENGKPVIDRVFRREELYEGPLTAAAPDLLIGWRDYAYYTSVSSEAGNGAIFTGCGKIDASDFAHKGTHRLAGTLIAAGPLIRRGAAVEGARLIDLGPTLLYLAGLSVPENMDGRVIEGIFEPDRLRRAPPRRGGRAAQVEAADVAYSDEESKDIEDRLKRLGYI